MKNLLNRLTRFMIIMLLLVDRTPFFNVYAVDQRDINTNGQSPLFMLQIDTNGSINQGCGVGQYDHFVALDDSVWNNETNRDTAFIRSLVVRALPEGDPDAGLNYELSEAKYAGNNITTVCVVAPYNVEPVAVDDTYNMQEDAVGGLVVALPGVLSNDTDGNGDTITAELVTGPTVGTSAFAFNADGSFTFSPIANYFGDVTFTYKALDSRGAYSNIATVTIKIASVNDLPIAASESHTILRGGTVTDAVSGSDVETLPVNLTFVIETGPTDYTSFTFYADGTFVYVHDITKSTTPVTFTFRAKDADNDLSANVGTVTINIDNQIPVTDDRSYETDEDVVLNVNAADGLLKNATDPESDALTVDTTVGTAPTKGSVVLNTDGSFTYTPDLNKFGDDTFTYRVSDGKGGLSIYKTVTITITEVNDAPVAADDSISAIEDTPKTFMPSDLLGNDVDVDGDTLSITSFTQPANGSLEFDEELGVFTFTPSANFASSTTFEYTISDGRGGTDTAVVTISVAADDDAPVAVDDTVETDEDTAKEFNVLTNDTDIDGGTKEVADHTVPENGTLENLGYGNFKYTPDADFNGSDSFEYTLNGGSTATVNITVNPINDRPKAEDDEVETDENVPLLIEFEASDVDGDSLIYGIVEQPLYGLLTGSGASMTYTPNPGFHGTDTFVFGVTDRKLRAYGTITITVHPLGSAPVAVDDPDGGEVEVFETPEDTALLLSFADLLTNDYDPDDFDYSEVPPVPGSPSFGLNTVNQPSNGTVEVDWEAGTLTYTPDPNYFGPDSFTYDVIDEAEKVSNLASVSIMVTPENDAPVALSNLYSTDEDTALVVDAPGVLGNDTDVEDSSLTAILLDGPNFATSFTLNSDGSFSYTPIANFSGLDSFTYKANDGLLDSNVATVTINVNPIEDAPVAVDDPDGEEVESLETPEDTPLVISFEDLLANDYDVDDITFGQITLMLTPLRSFDFNTAFSPSVGSLSLDMTARTVTFTPPLNYVGPAQFEYTIIDEDDNVSEPATVFIEVTPVNDAPVASPLAFTIANAGSSTGQLVASDVDDTELVFSLLAAPANGSATVSPAGVYTYTHNGTATLSDSFTFSVTDGELSATATVTVTVLAAPTPPPANLPPIANALSFTIANGAVGTGTLTGSDPEGAPISFSIATLPANGSLSISPAGIYVYDHNGTATTSDSFTFTVSDGSLTATATVSITILPIPTPPPAGNTPPEVIDGVVSTPFGEVIEGNVAPLGSDADGDDLTFELVDGPTNGTLVFNPDGTYTYTPNEGFDGSDSFTFIANDGTDDSNTGTLTINVLEEEVIVEEPETPLAAPDNNWLWWLLALLAGLLLWLLAFLRPNMKYTLSDKANNQKIVRRRLAKPDDKSMIVELNDKDMVGLTTIEVEFYKRLAKHCGGVNVKFMLKGTQVHSVTIPEGTDDVFTTIIHL